MLCTKTIASHIKIPSQIHKSRKNYITIILNYYYYPIKLIVNSKMGGVDVKVADFVNEGNDKS